MTDVELARYRLAIKESILHYLCDDWNNQKNLILRKWQINIKDKLKIMYMKHCINGR